MGIELPGELADVAAKAGVRWPAADEEAMRTSAQAWRQAGTKLTALAKDADGTANQALSAVSGPTGVAASKHWQTFVAPDTGHLTSTAAGCANAADRLDHAADQVGAAKVQIVSHLVNLAKNTDAANQAAAAGHPTALAGLHTTVQDTASSVAQVNHSLTNSIRLDHAVPVTQVAAQVTQPVTHGVIGQHDISQHMTADTGPLVAINPAHHIDPTSTGPTGPDGGHTGPVQVTPAAAQPVVQPVAQPIGAVLGGHGAGPGDPGLVHSGAPTPAMGVTVAQSAAPALAAPPVGVASTHTDFAPPPPAQPAPAPQPGFGGAGAAPTPSFGTPVPQQPTAAPAPSPMAPPPAAAATRTTQAAPPPAADNRRQDAGQAQDPVAAPEMSRPARQSQRRDPNVALFLVYLFPIGQLPKASSRPVRQLPPPAEETDFAAGLRFEPHDHPESHLMDTSTVAPAPIHPGLAEPTLAGHYDPLGGEHERDWDRRFLVRPADDEHSAEYAWPPGELFPEGGCDDGEPEVLAPDTVIDRFGTADGRVFSADGTPFARRSLPPDHLTAGYHRYRVTRELPVWRTLSAAWFGQPGGGVRYRAVYPAADLVAMGYLTELTGTEHGPEHGH
ncbi:MAG TPA: TNT domain-containing protein [Pseudonocardiaceae bacterium]|nr:TNT domain-containing protein [Pseudonocardiaceae bacterium]